MRSELERLRSTEVWIAWLRVLAVPWAVLEVGVLTDDYPPAYHDWAWVTTGFLGVGAAVFFVLGRADLGPGVRRIVGATALVFDVAIVYGYSLVFSFELGQPTWGVLYLPVVEGALRYGLRGGLAVPLATAPLLFLLEWWRAEQFPPPPYEVRHASLPLGISVLMGLIVGWLVNRFRGEAVLAEERAAEAEGLRDQLGRRADQLEAVNRAGRALASSLDQQRAFRAFVREMRGVCEFDRLAVVLAAGDRAEVLAVGGLRPATSSRRAARSRWPARCSRRCSSRVKPSFAVTCSRISASSLWLGTKRTDSRSRRRSS